MNYVEKPARALFFLGLTVSTTYVTTTYAMNSNEDSKTKTSIIIKKYKGKGDNLNKGIPATTATTTACATTTEPTTTTATTVPATKDIPNKDISKNEDPQGLALQLTKAEAILRDIDIKYKEHISEKKRWEEEADRRRKEKYKKEKDAAVEKFGRLGNNQTRQMSSREASDLEPPLDKAYIDAWFEFQNKFHTAWWAHTHSLNGLNSEISKINETIKLIKAKIDEARN